MRKFISTKKHKRVMRKEAVILSLFQLEYFAVLAETLNYTKASEQLHITQPNLSQMIKRLEESLDVTLFYRDNRNVQLSHTGVVFYEYVKEILSLYDQAVEKAVYTEKGIIGKVELGFLGTGLVRYLPMIVQRFHTVYPEIEIVLKDYTYSPLVDVLIDKKIDMAILPDNELVNIRGIEKKHFFSDSMCLVVHDSHPLANREMVDFSDFKEEPFIIMHPKVSIRDYKLVMGMSLEQDCMLNVAYKAYTLINLIMMVECQVGVSILAKHMEYFATENVQFIEIRGYEHYFKMICAWHKNTNPANEKLLNIISSIDTAK